MSAVTIIEHNEASTTASHPCVQIFRDKQKITKGIRLAPKGGNKQQTCSPSITPIKGVSLISKETSEILAPNSSPRPENEVPTENHVCISQPLVFYPLDTWETEDGKSLSVIGAHMKSGSLTSSSNKVNSNYVLKQSAQDKPVQTQTRHEEEPVGGYEAFNNEFYQTPVPLHTPEVPPSTPYGRPASSIKDFKVDGMHINTLSNCGLRIASSRDFIPGYVKRASYCCDKCEIRMVGHESLNRETASPFYAYQRQCYSRLNSLSDELLLDEDYCNYDYMSYLHLLTKSESKSDKLPINRSTSPLKNRSRSVARSNFHGVKDECSVRSKSCIPCQGVCKENEKCEEQRHRCSTSVDMRVPLHEFPDGSVKSETSSIEVDEKRDCPENYRNGQKRVDFHKNCLYNIADQTDFSKQEDFNLERGSQVHLCDAVGESESNESNSSDKRTTEDQPNILWKDTWNRGETVVSPAHGYLKKTGSVCSNNDSQRSFYDAPSTSKQRGHWDKDQNSNTMEDNLLPNTAKCRLNYVSSEKLHEILRECVDSLTSIHRRVASGKQDDMEKLVNGILPDIALPSNDLCFDAVTDKRYNRWKRRRKKKLKSDKIPVDSDSSSDEIENVRSTTPLPNNLRRRKRTEEQTDKVYPSDAGSEITSSETSYQLLSNDKLSESKNSAHVLNRKDRTESHISSSNDGNDQSDAQDTELFSFPALNNYHTRLKRRSEQDLEISKKGKDKPECPPSPVKDRPASPTKESQGNDLLKNLSGGNLAKEQSSGSNLSREEQKPLIQPPPFIQHTVQSETSFPKRRYPDSLARRTIFRLSHSIDQKLQKSTSLSSPVGESLHRTLNPEVSSFKRERIYSDKSAKNHIETTSQSLATLTKARPRRLSQIKPGLPLIDPDRTKPDLSSLTLSHLLMSMSGRRAKQTSIGKKKPNTSKPQPEECDISPRTNRVQLKEKRKSYTERKREENRGIDRRTCIGNRWSAEETSSSGSSQPEPMTRAISNLSFTPAFTFSFFELSRDYKLENGKLYRRSEM